MEAGEVYRLALTQMGLARADDGEAERITERNPSAFGPFSQRDAEAAAAPDSTSGSAARSLKVHEVSRDDTERADVDAVLARLRKDQANQHILGPETPYGSSQSFGPRSLAQRNREESRELANGRPQGRIGR
jgi:hypothetical protein